MACGIWDRVRISVSVGNAVFSGRQEEQDSSHLTANRTGAQQVPLWVIEIKLSFVTQNERMLYLLHFQSKCQWNIRGDRDQDFMWLPHLVCRALPVCTNLSTACSNLCHPRKQSHRIDPKIQPEELFAFLNQCLSHN